MKEFEHTSSAKFAFEWAGENLTGFISNSRTLTPRIASCHAASHPARPAPIMFIVLFIIFIPSLLVAYFTSPSSLRAPPDLKNGTLFMREAIQITHTPSFHPRAVITGLTRNLYRLIKSGLLRVPTYKYIYSFGNARNDILAPYSSSFSSSSPLLSALVS